jgi:hypothetical protein
MNNFLFRISLFSCFVIASASQAQTSKKYNLSRLLNQHKLITYHKEEIMPLADSIYQGISSNGNVWLKDVYFSTGSIDIDLRGKDVFQQSFLGIIFHGVDSVTYDAVYFRPFNFRSADTLRRKHAVQYMSEPDYPWDRLRKEHPLVYENAVTPAPLAVAWFHAHIVIDENWIKIYVNRSATPSLVVKKLNTRTNGLIGIMNDGLSGDFANLVIKPDR